MKRDLELSFDVGHSSIGWAVLQNQPQLEVKGCGAVIFRADDCLASARRGHRRQRRHIRSTRQRIARMKLLLRHLGVLSEDQLDKPGCAWPWKLAARVLAGGKTLNWPELWEVLRWYAHNRGYDANRRWSATEAETEKEDTEKLENAKTLLGKHGVKTMAETFCKELGIDPLGAKSSSMTRFKGLNAAFPRAIVEAEVARILQVHFGKLKGVDEKFATALFSDWRAIPCADIKLPQRYQGGLLFGQLVPRFDNRIISTCPITGQKVPSRNTPEFLNFRWGMLLANVRVARLADRELKPLTPEERKELDKRMRAVGSMTEKQFKEVVRDVSGAIRGNFDTMFMEVNQKEALILDPVQDCLTSGHAASLFPTLPERIQKRARGQLRRGKTLKLGELGNDIAAFDAEVQRILDKAAGRGRKKDKALTRESLLAECLAAKKLSGRAAYSRPILRKAFEEVMAGKHPKEDGGCLFVTEQMRQAQLNRSLAEQTNNHLVRHRLLILERLQQDIIKEFAGGDKSRIGRITIEVNRDLREMSGKTAKEIASDLGLRLANFKSVRKKLEAAFEGKNIQITPGLMRKARIAEDLGWTCPYTGELYDAFDLLHKKVDLDHVVPRADRSSNALDSLVVTFPEVNRMKGKRTALAFMMESGGKTVEGLPRLMLKSMGQYKSDIEALRPKSDPRNAKKRGILKGPIDDDLRRWKRKELLLKVEKWEGDGFLPGDLTATSQLVRLGAQVLRQAFDGSETQPAIVSLPNQVTGAVRRAWKVLGCLSLACPEVMKEDGTIKEKTEIRGLTHLHHAVDACVLGLAAHLIPNNGGVWAPIANYDLQLRDMLPNELKEQIRKRLAEKRVAQHIPADMSGLGSDDTLYRVFDPNDPHSDARRIRRWFEKLMATGGLKKLSHLPDPRDRNEPLVLLTARKRRNQPGGESGKTLHDTEKEWRWIYVLTAKSAVHGLDPSNGVRGKLAALKAVKLLGDNFGVACIGTAGQKPRFQILRPRKVWKELAAIRQENPTANVDLIRKGMLVSLEGENGENTTLRIFGCGERPGRGIYFDVGDPDAVERQNEVQVSAFASGRARVARTSLTGAPC